MGSQTQFELPLIDFSSIYLNESTQDVWHSVKTQVHEALTEYGFFRASMAGISPEFRRSSFDSLDQLFDLPLETKLKRISKKHFDGYIGPSPAMPLYESMIIPDAPLAGGVESFTEFFWPHGNPVFCKNIRNISAKLHWLDQIVRKMILESLGLEKYLDDQVENTNYLLRVTKYKEPDTDESRTGLVSHVDKTIISVLYQNEVSGLEFQTKQGEWIRVEQLPESFTIVVGEVFNAWTNGRLHAPYHRVMMTGKEARYSFGLFSVPKAGYITKVPDELVDKEHPLLFNPFDYDEFLKYLFTKPHVTLEAAPGAYVGKESELKKYSHTFTPKAV